METESLGYEPTEERSKRVKDYMKYAMVALCLALQLFRLPYILYLLQRSLCAWRRREFIVQSILWLSLGETIFALLYTIDIASDNKVSDFLFSVSFRLLVIYNQAAVCGILSNGINLVFVLEYDLLARSLPFVLQKISLNMRYAHEKK